MTDHQGDFFDERHRSLPRGIKWGVAGLIVIFIGGLSAVAQNTTPYAYAPQQPNFYVQDTNWTPYYVTSTNLALLTLGQTNSGTYGFTLNKTIREDKGLSVFASLVAPNATNNTVTTIYLGVTYDGVKSNGVPGALALPPITANGTTPVIVWTNFPASLRNNVRSVFVSGYTNTAGGGTTNVLTISKLVYSWSGQ